ncbi:Asp23/Gls24 family envelope stress response protein [Streptomyces sp. NPDC005402]|uniref:Asp23/Gls24 family envelope stress response protein n=1 Tax=Streptomyces sp. NPDC005402 TaxID=3155338 RepID=UPI0033B2F7E9
MTSVSSENGTADELRGPLTATAVPPADRGATRIADRVVAKVAGQAAREALGKLPAEAEPPYATVVVLPHSRVRSNGGTPTAVVRVRVHLELDYPCDIGTRCREVRQQVGERVVALVGMEVSEVSVQVERLHPAQAHGAAKGRTR